MSNSISLHGFDFITFEDGDRNNEIVIKQIQDFHAELLVYFSWLFWIPSYFHCCRYPPIFHISPCFFLLLAMRERGEWLRSSMAQRRLAFKLALASFPALKGFIHIMTLLLLFIAVITHVISLSNHHSKSSFNSC